MSVDAKDDRAGDPEAGDGRLADVAVRLDQWMREVALPLWWSAGRHDNGAFYECLDFGGAPVPAPESRVRVQARQIFSFSLAHKIGWRADAVAADIAQSVHRFAETCFRSDGVAGRRVDIERGVLVDETADLYDNAFCLLALAQSRHILDDNLSDNLSDKLIGRLLLGLDENMAYANAAGYREVLPAPSSRRQNPHMHLFESLLLLYQVTGDAAIRRRAESLFEFIDATFFDYRQRIVCEEIDPDRAQRADRYEPGHSMEWVWLLGYRTRLFDIELHELAVPLYEHYCAASIDEGRTPMCLTTDNRPVDSTRRLWSQTESLKAHLCMLELGPAAMTSVALQRAVACGESILNDWLGDVHPGGWQDHFDSDGQCISAQMPASTGYHLFLAIAELSRIAGSLGPRQG